ncbi:peptide-methionine (S)-S-oxide reductase MsrA [Geomicrobium sp. JCM 19038]|uniref:peptide-methionine (S)-S-oxide reductase MsrA n=1 Tax=Geomicrobium sp. JCM 19038 TaxID=1460635 RepID=UPI00045F14BE|nr:peptide-methionine (S)-S-oxide reductase MsrA [Geomicrobium sp. JCM 19038]GAK10060.1 peptide methionine sulfoxide reductase MsrA [Geomicrobium sp. JCM 19038]
MEKATFAGGCFWCMVGPFQAQDGVTKVRSGYTGGHTEDPTYREVCSDTTGHVEAIQIDFDPGVVSYDRLLEIFWMNIDPTDADGQFNDRGDSYKTAIFYHSDEQKDSAEKSRTQLEKSGPFEGKVITPIVPAKVFYDAEEEHQDYHLKNPFHYQLYKRGSGRAGFIKKHWGNES